MRRAAAFGVVVAIAVGLAGVTLAEGRRAFEDYADLDIPDRASGHIDHDGMSCADLEIGQPVTVSFAARIVEGLFDGYLLGQHTNVRVRLANGDALIVRAGDAHRRHSPES